MRVIPPGEIDRNGLHRSNLAGLRAMLDALTPPAEACLVDGFRLGPPAPEHRAVVDGDEKSAAIAAASIVAKVTRDRLMRRLDALYPAYGFALHVGYITPGHSARRARARARRDVHRRRSRRSATSGEAARATSRPRRQPRRRARAGWYRLRGWRILGANVWAGGNELDLIVRRGRRLVFVEVKEKSGRALRRPARDGRPPRSSGACAGRRRRGSPRTRSSPRSRSASTSSPCATAAVASALGARRSSRSRRTASGPWPRRRTRSTRRIDLELSWSERDLPERERTKHVHRLHPYLGKFIPQLVEVLLARYVAARRPRARPVRRLGDDARAGARVAASTRPASTSPRSTAC